MKLTDLKREFAEKLSTNYTKKEAESLFFIFVEEYLGIRRIDYLTDPHKILGEGKLATLHRALERLARGEPYQHILGEVHFADLRLRVSRAALVPRPETEELVYLIRDELKPNPPANLLDIGTGTGCIALACAKFFRGTTITAIDVSDKALELARSNAVMNRLRVNFQSVDFLKGAPLIEREWEAIVSNPPYIARWESGEMEGVVKKHDPWEALFVPDDDPLVFYRAIAGFGSKYLKSGGRIFLEVNERLGEETCGVFPEAVYETRLLKDLSGKPRFVIADKK